MLEESNRPFSDLISAANSSAAQLLSDVWNHETKVWSHVTNGNGTKLEYAEAFVELVLAATALEGGARALVKGQSQTELLSQSSVAAKALERPPLVIVDTQPSFTPSTLQSEISATTAVRNPMALIDLTPASGSDAAATGKGFDPKLLWPDHAVVGEIIKPDEGASALSAFGKGDGSFSQMLKGTNGSGLGSPDNCYITGLAKAPPRIEKTLAALRERGITHIKLGER